MAASRPPGIRGQGSQEVRRLSARLPDPLIPIPACAWRDPGDQVPFVADGEEQEERDRDVEPVPGLRAIPPEAQRDEAERAIEQAREHAVKPDVGPVDLDDLADP